MPNPDINQLLADVEEIDSIDTADKIPALIRDHTDAVVRFWEAIHNLAAFARQFLDLPEDVRAAMGRYRQARAGASHHDIYCQLPFSVDAVTDAHLIVHHFLTIT